MKPILDKNIKPKDFLNFYWLKEELVAFCKKHLLPTKGNKKDLTDRIYHYLSSGVILSNTTDKIVKNKGLSKTIDITPDSIIPEHYRNDEIHRAFFKKFIGEHFKFNVPFMNWMKENAGKTYQEAINEWQKIYEEKKQGKKYSIPSQFEYNQYIRDFFKANPDKTQSQAIKCWKYKKSLPGNNKYEDKDLTIL